MLANNHYQWNNEKREFLNEYYRSRAENFDINIIGGLLHDIFIDKIDKDTITFNLYVFYSIPYDNYFTLEFIQKDRPNYPEVTLSCKISTNHHILHSLVLSQGTSYHGRYIKQLLDYVVPSIYKTLSQICGGG